MKKNSDRLGRSEERLAPARLGLERQPTTARSSVPDYFTLYLLQELFSSIGRRHKH